MVKNDMADAGEDDGVVEYNWDNNSNWGQAPTKGSRKRLSLINRAILGTDYDSISQAGSGGGIIPDPDDF
jgi:hypothetical protein